MTAVTELSNELVEVESQIDDLLKRKKSLTERIIRTAVDEGAFELLQLNRRMLYRESRSNPSKLEVRRVC